MDIAMDKLIDTVMEQMFGGILENRNNSENMGREKAIKYGSRIIDQWRNPSHQIAHQRIVKQSLSLQRS
jgi:hypothetical protein